MADIEVSAILLTHPIRWRAAPICSALHAIASETTVNRLVDGSNPSRGSQPIQALTWPCKVRGTAGVRNKNATCNAVRSWPSAPASLVHFNGRADYPEQRRVG